MVINYFFLVVTLLSIITTFVYMSCSAYCLAYIQRVSISDSIKQSMVYSIITGNLNTKDSDPAKYEEITRQYHTLLAHLYAVPIKEHVRAMQSDLTKIYHPSLLEFVQLSSKISLYSILTSN